MVAVYLFILVTLQTFSNAKTDVCDYACTCIIILNIYFSSVPPSIDGPAEESVMETISNPIAFSCDAAGIPPPSLIWLKNGQPIGRPRSNYQ